jgi:hypothetical protein
VLVSMYVNLLILHAVDSAEVGGNAVVWPLL